MLEGRIVISALMVLVFGGAVAISLGLDPRAARLPLVVGIPGLILSVVQLVKELRETNPEMFSIEHRRRELIMFGWFFGFVGGLVLFGFMYGGPVLVAVFLYFSGREKWYVCLGAAAFAAVVLYGVFEQFLGLAVFRGLLFQWLF